MKRLPLHLLHRLRRKLRRAMTSDARQRLRLIEEFCGRRPPPSSNKPPDLMKITFLAILGTLIGITLFGLTSCATVETVTTVTAPDGTVTVTESKTTAPDAGSVSALSTTAQAFAPRAVIVNSGK